MLELKFQYVGHLVQRTDSLENTSFFPSYQRVTTVWNLVYAVTDFIFLGSKITLDGNCSQETKRPLLLGRNAVANLDSLLKSRDITLPTKIHIVKAVVFPVVMYGCESWTKKKGRPPKNWCLWTVVLEKNLDSPLDCKEIQLVHPKGKSTLNSH